jgi:hypothetical protein
VVALASQLAADHAIPTVLADPGLIGSTSRFVNPYNKAECFMKTIEYEEVYLSDY